MPANIYPGADIVSGILHIPNNVQKLCDGCCAYWPLAGIEFEKDSQVREFGDYAFYNAFVPPSCCITIPASVETIGELCFYHTSAVASMIIEDGSRLNSIGCNAFLESSCKIHIPNRNIWNTVSQLIAKDMSFVPEMRLHDVIPNLKTPWRSNNYDFAPGTISISADGSSVVVEHADEIEQRAFYTDVRIKTLEFKADSGLRSIGNSAFFECSGIRELVIPDSVEEIDENAFRDCVELARLGFGDNTKLKRIGDFAFYGHHLESLVVPNSVEHMGILCFGSPLRNYDFSVTMHNASKLQKARWRIFPVWMLQKNVHIPRRIRKMIGMVFNKTPYMNTDKGRVMMPNIILGKHEIETVRIPNDVEVILPGTYADWEIKRLRFDPRSSIKILGDAAFMGAPLVNIEIPSSIEHICPFCFHMCVKFQYITHYYDGVVAQKPIISKNAFDGGTVKAVHVSNERMFKEFFDYFQKTNFIPNMSV